MICSVIVLTYNSELTILETLESISLQSYDDIELVIADDCSSDNTLRLVDRWMDQNNNRFVKATIVKASTNSGICKNINRSVKASSGAWIKFIAGDDILLPSCVEDNMKHVLDNSCPILFSKTIAFDSCSGSDLYELPDVYDKQIFLLSAEKQYNQLLYRCFPPAPSLFISRELIRKLSLFDEQYLAEDHPSWLKITEQGIRLSYMDKATVRYRKNISSITSTEQGIVSRFNFSVKKIVFFKAILPRLKLNNIGVLYHHFLDLTLDRLILGLGNKWRFLKRLVLLKNASFYFFVRKYRKLKIEKSCPN